MVTPLPQPQSIRRNILETKSKSSHFPFSSARGELAQTRDETVNSACGPGGHDRCTPSCLRRFLVPAGISEVSDYLTGGDPGAARRHTKSDEDSNR